MIVHFSSGETLPSTDLKEWDNDSLVAFGRVINNFGTSKDLRFCALSGEGYSFAFVRTEAIDFIEFDREEYDLMQKALYPPQEEEKKE